MAFKSRFPWLKDLKENGKKKNDVELTKITVIGQSPISGRTDIGFTGYGEDGRFQPSQPTSMFGAAGGPVMEHEGEARIELPDGEKMVIPADQLDQKTLSKMKGMRGAQKGGRFLPATSTPVSPQMERPTLGTGQRPQMQMPTGRIGSQPFTTPQTTTPQITQPQGPGPITPEPITPQVQPEFNVTPGDVTVPQITQPMGAPDLGTGIGKPPRPPAGATPTPEAISPIGIKPPDDAVSPTPTPTPTPPHEGSPEYQQALQRLKRISEGYDPVAEKIREEERMRLAGEEAASRLALEQMASQMGLTGRELLTEQAMLGRDFGAQETALMAALRKGEADRAFQASMALPGATLAGMQFKFEQKKWEDMSELEKEKWNFNKESWQKEFDLAKEQWGKMFDWGKEKWDYGKKMDMVNALMQQGGPENLQKASEMLEGIFGNGVDFTNALNAENQQQFFSGMDIMSSSLASGLDWEQTMAALDKAGLLDQMGMTEGDLKGMYDNMKLQSDPLYQAMNMADQWLEQGWMNQDEYDDFIDMIKYGLTNTEGFNIEDGFVVMDKNGNEVGFFKTQEEMEKWISENPGEYTSVFKKNHITPKDEGPGEGDGTTPGPDATNTKLKDLFGRDPTPEEAALFSDEKYFDIADAFVNNQFKDLSRDDLYNLREFYDKLPTDYKDKHKLSEIVNQFSPTYGKIMEEIENDNVTHDKILNTTNEDFLNELREKYGIEGDIDPNDPQIEDRFTMNMDDIMKDFDFYVAGYGWKLNEEAKQFVKQNKGKYFEHNGRVFKLIGRGTGQTGGRQYHTLTIYDPMTNQTYDIAHQTGNKGDVFTWQDLFEEQDKILTDSPDVNFINDYYKGR